VPWLGVYRANARFARGILVQSEAELSFAAWAVMESVINLAVDKGLLLKQKNYFSDKTTGYRHGNFYICRPGVRFEESVPHTTHCIYFISVCVGHSRGPHQ
jgi:hypothetical protein